MIYMLFRCPVTNRHPFADDENDHLSMSVFRRGDLSGTLNDLTSVPGAALAAISSPCFSEPGIGHGIRHGIRHGIGQGFGQGFGHGFQQGFHA